MSFEIEGKLIKKFDTENKSGSFQAREFVIEVESGNYPQFVKFQLTQDRCAAIDSYTEGHAIKVHFDLRGREWQGKYFTNLNAWRLENPATAAKAPAAAPVAAAPSPAASTPAPTVAAVAPATNLDDLPF
jgi:single-strand DNA-binding protein